ncbi:Actin-like protein arp5 [Schizosaccharomyces pombe]|uniref:Actin-like protein arp5 n=1 Tax=Schizosaccharomyces pombe (strain 972 / ATCC 24843) TaxID=284812 RepID=ARP5_SCHPO|nr:actin-like protein Arp5 [Schizosaccharomyces pombe]Q9Y7X8.1 RecName: Full=Actin-like protein arp5 [Schizosaccharomyces pombe 972h-]CAB44762.1 actin-like protein Arp5 [Schizosaccharomyces pombe]|eukprot:NP_596039.1 actin-like protein Arp5 [Schizosaccharomyces pombe]
MKIYAVREPVFSGPTPSFQNVSNDIPLVIDNGSWQLRAGWGGEKDPKLVFDNLVSRYRDRKLSRTSTLVGNDTLIEVGSRSIARSPFERNVISNWDLMEQVLDYTFLKLGIDRMEHPICMTEPLANPTYVRSTMTELLFELYNAPSVAYGIDGLFSFYHNTKPSSSGIVLNLGNAASHVIPVLNGERILSEAKRISWGGSQSSSYLLKLFQIKYPSFPIKMLPSQAELLMHDHCHVSSDYTHDIAHALDRDILERDEIVLQFPYTEAAAQEKSQEELELIAERKRESGRRLQAQAAIKRKEKAAERDRELATLTELQQQSLVLSRRAFQRALEEAGFEDESQLNAQVKNVQAKIRRAQRDQQRQEESEGSLDVTEIDVEQAFPLLNVPDAELDEAGLRQKRHQRLMKANYDARVRAKAEKAIEEAAEAERAEADERLRLENFSTWVNEKRETHKILLEKISKNKRLKFELNDRKSHASQMRMKSLATLASEQPIQKRKRKDQSEDNFGARDEDWKVYHDVLTAEQLEEERKKLLDQIYSLEKQLLEYDSQFTQANTYDTLNDPRATLLYAFTRGVSDFDVNDVAQAFQLHLNVEQIRVPEVIFSPSIVGIDQAGILEIMRSILQRHSLEEQQKLVSNVLITGGLGSLPGMETRIKRELTSIMPVGSSINVFRASNPLLDAWKGASEWSVTEKFKAAKVTREEYLEKGPEYIKEHSLGNINS